MGDPSRPRPDWLDLGYQRLYRAGYLALRPWWRLTRPRTRGAFVGVWWGGQVLLVQNSYVRYRSFPGGGVRRGEPPVEAAARECREEVGLEVEPRRLRSDFVVEQAFDGKRDQVWLFELDIEHEPRLRIDHREVVHAGFVAPEEALEAPLFEPARRHIEGRLRRGGLTSP